MLAVTLAVVLSSLPVTAASLPEAPQRRVDTAWPSSTRTVRVPAGGSLQAALDAARPGDAIALAPGATYRGPFTLPRKDGAGWIVVRPDVPDGELPPAGVRVTAAAAARMPRLVSSSGPVVQAAPGAHHYRLVALDIRPEPNAGIATLVELGGDARALDEVPHHLVIDRCHLRGDPTAGTRRGIALNAAWSAVVDSLVWDVKSRDADAQAIAGWSGPGPFRIANNLLEASGENVMFGGADPSIPGLVPSDIEIHGNQVEKPLAWKVGHPDYAGAPWMVKNLLELKNARRVTIDGNVFLRNWSQAQNGFAILFTVRNQDGAAPWSVVEDVAFTGNVVRDTPSGINILGYDRSHSSGSGRTRRILIRDNLFLVGGSGRDDEGRLFQILEGTADVVIDHNTAVNGGAVIMAEGAQHSGFVYTNNIAVHNAAGIVGTDTGSGWPTLGRYFPGAVVRGNVLVGGPAAGYPRDNYFPGSLGAVGFADAASGDYRLRAGSRFRGAAAGRDPGADVATLPRAIEGRGPCRARGEPC